LAFKGIRVNAIAPGWIVTDINREYLTSEAGAAIKREIPVGRFGEERDLDGALLLLASDAGRFIAGTTLGVDGGQMVALRDRSKDHSPATNRIRAMDFTLPPEIEKVRMSTRRFVEEHVMPIEADRTN